MLHIILTILKIIGIILLAIIGLVLLICACILFVPVRYNARITYKDKLIVKAQITYLLHFICANYSRKDNVGNTELRILGFRTHFFDDDRKKKKKKYDEDTKMFEEMSEKRNMSKSMGFDIAESNRESKAGHKEETIFTKNSVPESGKTENNTEKCMGKISSPEKKRSEDEEAGGDYQDKPTWFGKIKIKMKGIIHKFQYRFKKICGTIRKVYNNTKNFQELISDEKTKKTISFTKTQAAKLIRHIRPKKIRGYLMFGFDDPSYTGKILGLIYMFSRGTKKNFQINPDFENKVFETDVQVKGRVQIYYLLIIAYRFYRNKNFREVLEGRRTYGRKQ